MKKQYIILSIVILVLFVTLSVCFDKFKTTNTYIEDSSSNQIKVTKGISMNLEQTAGAGDYKTVTQSKWPTEGYKFNSELSRCENGSKISWDDTNNTVVVSGNLSDKCYVYFDLIPTIADYCSTGTELASCIKRFGNLGPSVSAIYIHNSNLINGAGDNSYRYAGGHNVVNNYVCLAKDDGGSCLEDNLFRIIGVFEDKVKLIRSEGIEDQEWSSNQNITNTWSKSSLNTYLNGEYLTSLGRFKSKIATTTWKIGGGSVENIMKSVPSIAYKYEVGANSLATTYSAKIGLMYVSDYYYAASPSAWTLVGYNSNDTTKDYRAAIYIDWLYNGYVNEWTITPSSGSPSEVFSVYQKGFLWNAHSVDPALARPVFNLESSVTYVSGSGSRFDPIYVN